MNELMIKRQHFRCDRCSEEAPGMDTIQIGTAGRAGKYLLCPDCLEAIAEAVEIFINDNRPKEENRK